MAGTLESMVKLMRAQPVGAVPPTPPCPAVAPETPVSEQTLLSVAAALGEPVGYVQEHGGRLVQNIVPERGQSDRTENAARVPSPSTVSTS